MASQFWTNKSFQMKLRLQSSENDSVDNRMGFDNTTTETPDFSLGKNSFEFCSTFSFEERIELSSSLVGVRKNYIALVCERAKTQQNSDHIAPKLNGHDTFFLLPQDTTVGQLKYMLRRRLKKHGLKHSFFLRLNGEYGVTLDNKLGDMKKFMSDDHFLYFTYETEVDEVKSAGKNTDVTQAELPPAIVSDVFNSTFSLNGADEDPTNKRRKRGFQIGIQWLAPPKVDACSYISDSYNRVPKGWFECFEPRCQYWLKISGVIMNCQLKETIIEYDERECASRDIYDFDGFSREEKICVNNYGKYDYLDREISESEIKTDNGELGGVVRQICECSRKCECLNKQLRGVRAFTLCGDVKTLLSSSRPSIKDIEDISRDIARTYPAIPYFQKEKVQHSLTRVLQAVAITFPSIGYVQSMNLLVAQFLIHSENNEDIAYALMCQLIDHPNYNMKSLYEPGLTQLLLFNRLLFDVIYQQDRALHQHLCEIGLGNLYFLHSWLLSLFSYTMPFDRLTEVWDFFFEHGWEAIFRIIIVLVLESRDLLLKSDFDQASTILRMAPMNPPKNFCNRAKRYPLSRLQIQRISAAIDRPRKSSKTKSNFFKTSNNSISKRKYSVRRSSISNSISQKLLNN